MVDKSSSDGEKLNTIIGQGTVIKGACSVKGTVRVDGVIDGSLGATGMAIIGKTGEIRGDLRVSNSIIGGKVDGSVLAEGRLELQSGARVEGDVQARKLVVEEGVFFNGRCDMSTAPGVAEELARQGAAKAQPSAPKKGGKGQQPPAAGPDEEITFQGKPV